MRKYYPGLLLFVVALVICLLCYKDYGISWDEPTQQGLGRLTYNYVVTGDKTIKTYDDRALGTAFELPLICIEKWCNIKDQHVVYEMRHLVTHIYFLLAALAAYVLGLKLFKNQWLACLAFLMLVCNPRMYAHSFFNSKDIPFLSAFVIAMLLCYVAFEKGKLLWFLLLGCAVGYAIGIRAIGVVLVPCIVVFFIADAIADPAGRKKSLAGLLAFLLAACATLYVSWPFLWGDPVFYIRDAFHRLAVINWHATVLFMGKSYSGMELPVSYLPVWFAITTPAVWLLCGLAGVLMVTWMFVTQPLKSLTDRHNRHFLMYLACFVLPPAAAILNHSAIIDDWRHMYFVYGPFMMLALYCVSSVKKEKYRKVLSGLGYGQAGYALFFMVANHPHQQVYFNELVSHEQEYLRTHYDLEYWGCAYKQGLQYILARDQSPVINVSGAGYDPVVNALRALPDSVQERVRITDEAHAGYFITNFRLHPGDYDHPVVLYEIKAQNSTFMRVYKMTR